MREIQTSSVLEKKLKEVWVRIFPNLAGSSVFMMSDMVGPMFEKNEFEKFEFWNLTRILLQQRLRENFLSFPFNGHVSIIYVYNITFIWPIF